MQLDYSRDGKWIAYASYPNGSVWRCAADGSERLQLTTPPLFARNPRWSPDGTQIVFYGGAPGNLDRLYLVPAQGGAVRQLTHSEAGPTGDADGGWSPDGSVLVFGSEQSDQLANQPRGLPLSSIELGSGRVSKLPGSEGMWSPRWSPNGRYIAGMRTPQDALWLYNVATHERRQLTSMSASWPNWSRDGQFLYFGNNTLWYRVRIDDAKVQPVAAVNGLKTADGGLGWIGLTPDSALISTRDAGNTEIYALDWETP
jgi:Tol biopolymer transport system component